MADIKWIKIYVDMFDHKKIKFIRKLPEGNDILLCWIMLLASAGKCNMGGHIFLTSDIPYTAEMLADEFGMATNTVRLALETFQKLNMVSLDNGIYVQGWEEYQNIDGMEKIRMQNRERAKKHYDKKKALLLEENSNVRTNVTLTQPNATDIDIDIEKEKKRKIKTIGDQVTAKIIEFTSDEGLRSALCDFIEMRNEIKKPVKTLRTIDLLLKELNKHENKIDVVNQSIRNNWQDLYPIHIKKDKNQESGNPYRRVD